MNAFESLSRHQPLFAEARGDIQVSFEFFPPKTDKMEQSLWESIKTLEPLHPRFVSVTYGAGGSTRDRTHATIERILRETRLTPAAHLTCVGASRAEIDAIARDYWELGVRHIVALRGDPSEPGSKFQPHPDGYRDAAALVAGLRTVAPFDISVAAYPEIHPDSSSRAFDIENLKRKVDAGASRAISQFFFSADCFFRFRDEAAAAGIAVEIVPGILPVSNVATTRRFAQSCGASIPQWLDELFEGLDDLPAARQLIAATVAAELCGQLYAGGVRCFHFYTLNRAELTYAISHLLGVRPKS
jgi:methylenetetrahydrofolate reductase (NADPH)